MARTVTTTSTRHPAPGRKGADPFYLSPAWVSMRRRILRRDPVCVECSAAAASHVDHIKPRRLFPELELEPTNLRGLCVRCHNSRSARQYSATASAVGLNGEPLDPSHPWHAGEAARVTFRGAERAPQAWQQPVLRAAMAGATPAGHAPAGDPDPGAGPIMALPPRGDA